MRINLKYLSLSTYAYATFWAVQNYTNQSFYKKKKKFMFTWKGLDFWNWVIFSNIYNSVISITFWRRIFNPKLYIKKYLLLHLSLNTLYTHNSSVQNHISNDLSLLVFNIIFIFRVFIIFLTRTPLFCENKQTFFVVVIIMIYYVIYRSIYFYRSVRAHFFWGVEESKNTLNFYFYFFFS